MIVINLLIIALFVLLVIKSKDYEKPLIEGLDSKQHRLARFYPMGLYVYDHLEKSTKHVGFIKQEESLKAIHVGESIPKVKRIYMCNKIVTVALVIFAFNLLAIFSYLDTRFDNNLLSNNVISRPKSSSDVKTIKLDVHITKEELSFLTEEISLDIYGRRNNKEELDELIIEAKQYIDETVISANESINEIRSDLEFVSYIPGRDLYISWDHENYQLISRDGKVNNEGIAEPVNTWVSATISYYELEFEYRIDLTILPRILGKEEVLYKKLIEEVEELDLNSKSEETLELPSEINGMDIIWVEKKDDSSLAILMMGIVAGILIFLGTDKDLYDKVEERNRQMLLDYPEIINKMNLLIGAGMPLANAWHKIVQDYKMKNRGKRYAYEEMIITSNELLLGNPEISAYEGFGRRVKLLPYLRFSSLIAQNVRKGSSDLLRTLELESIDSFQERKELTKRIGEEAGTKLLFPMMIMLLIVLIIVIVPAFLSFQI